MAAQVYTLIEILLAGLIGLWLLKAALEIANTLLHILFGLLALLASLILYSLAGLFQLPFQLLPKKDKTSPLRGFPL